MPALVARLARWAERAPATGHPMYPGAVVLLARNGTVLLHHAVGTALRYADAEGTELPAAAQIPMRVDTVFDLASLSKLFTALVTIRMAADGAIDLSAQVARYVPRFAAGGKSEVTVEQLLTHTSGLAAEPVPPLWTYPGAGARREAVLRAPLRHRPGSACVYSDLNMLIVQHVVQITSGMPLDELVAGMVTGPLDMRDTGYNPPMHRRHRIAPTEFQGAPDRGLVWGQVHDENAWALGGVAGHAGVFSTAADLARLGQALLPDGPCQGNRILPEGWVDALFTDRVPGLPGNARSLVFELDRRWYMGELAGRGAAGHTGFTGTSIVLDHHSGSLAVLLTNRVHPSRDRAAPNPARRAAATTLAYLLKS